MRNSKPLTGFTGFNKIHRNILLIPKNLINPVY